MITKFGSLFAGHVDLDNLGWEGTPANDRRYSNDHLATVFDKTIAIATLMDRVGYDTFWMAEHHFQHEGYECIPNIMQLSVHMAHLTDNIKFGCGFNIAPMWHPLRMAEDYATADILTGGRMIFGVGRGYHTREVEVFGNPMLDADANRDLFEEQVDVIMKAFKHESFSHHGKNYDIPPDVPYRGYDLKEITLVPRPVNPVETWQPIVSASERGLNFMAKHGIKGIIGGGAAVGGAALTVLEAWQKAQADHGIETELGGNVILGLSYHIAETVEKAIEEARPFYEENMKMFAPLGFVRGLTDDQLDALGDPKRAPHAGLPTLEQAVESGSWLVGTPESIKEKLEDIGERLPGLVEVNMGNPVGTPQSVLLEQLEAFGTEVMPHFKGRVPAEAPADD
ncbi:MAG: LLM class flavin-dependent oxidoreductase [SAR202 cluster bacterium]|jgi:alkanesulfonate monooxygenase SsuD/methylene tetrahydromethanopterin reductase-like flavin-dependent oxidoreductase (luciferase family)|nr:LLM class flavin-dependent oxidoreductase [SAR202 cluster bacterium]